MADEGRNDLPEAADAFYAAYGGTIGPLNDAAVAILPTPTTLPQFQQVMLARLENRSGTRPDQPQLRKLLGVAIGITDGEPDGRHEQPAEHEGDRGGSFAAAPRSSNRNTSGR